jgi:hypothetical protein
MDSTTNLDLLATSQSNKELRINDLMDAASPSTYFGRRASTCSGLTWGFYGGKLLIAGVETAIANGTLALTASTTNYVQLSAAGVVSVAATRAADQAPLYSIVTSATAVVSYVDERDPSALKRLAYGRTVQAMADANKTLSQAQALCDSIECTGANTAVRNLVVPLVRRAYTVFANVTGSGIQVIAATGTGITIAVGKRAMVECDGTNVVRLTADV